MMKILTVDEFQALLRSSGAPSSKQVCFVCPMCGTVQNMVDLIRAGAGKTEDEVSGYIGFSCLGRFTHQLAPSKVKGQQKGCNWTLGGLFQTHKLEVVDEDGAHHPRFEVASVEQTAVHLLDQALVA